MRLGNPATQRPAFYDRAPLPQTINSTAEGIGPHAQTQRAIYTTPGTKKAVVVSVFLQITRQTVAAPKGRPKAILNVAGVIQAQLQLTENVVDATIAAAWSPAYVLAQSETIQLFTSDTSTGGTLDYGTYAGIEEFDQ